MIFSLFTESVYDYGVKNKKIKKWICYLTIGS